MSSGGVGEIPENANRRKDEGKKKRKSTGSGVEKEGKKKGKGKIGKVEKRKGAEEVLSSDVK